MTALIPILQVLLSVLPEFEAIWPVVAKLLSSGQPPQPADMAALWAAAAAVHARVQAGAATSSAALAPGSAGIVANPGALA